MSRLTELLRQARKVDPQLGSDLEKEVAALMKRRTFGLVFEQHQPEAVELPGRIVRRGDKVRILRPRGDARQADQRLWRVDRIQRVDGSRVAHLKEVGSDEPMGQTALTDDLVVVAEFNDLIFPGLRETGRVERGGDKPFHTVINAENYHALEMLTYTHRQRVDVIYIDPPYNTGARDWKYNNNYVEGEDDYRHSKWLAFMERRLKIAHDLLNPENSVLIVTIDEKEYLRLGLLLEQTFPSGSVQMVSSAINPKGVFRSQALRRTDEYIFIVSFGTAAPARCWDTGESDSSSRVPEGPGWTSLMRRGSNSARSDRPNLFYPIYVDPIKSEVVDVGPPILDEAATAPARDGLVTVLPIRRDRSHGNWQVSSPELLRHKEQGRIRVGRPTHYGFVINYLPRGEYQAVMSEAFNVHGRAEDGSLLATRATLDQVGSIPPTQWNKASHNASENGSTLLRKMLPGRKFPFPKSLYAVEDILRIYTLDNPHAIVLDFFSGSGTTTHALMRLNKQDGGQRQSISVTNNEVSADDQIRLRKQGLRPGDPEWESLGICDHITKPRVTGAITGRTPEGELIKGDYKFTDESPISDGLSENAAYFTLTYEAPLAVRHNRKFEMIASMLWLRAGSRGRIITDLGAVGWDVAEAYGVLENVDRLSEFISAVSDFETVRTVFVITDSDAAFHLACRELPERVTAVRLYESYLHNFQINRRAGA